MPARNAIQEWAEAQTWREVTYLPAEAPTMMTAAAYLAVVTYPDDLDKRDRFILAVTAWAHKVLRDAFGRSDVDALMRPRDIEAAFETATRLLNIRLRASRGANEIALTRSSPAMFRGARTVREAAAVMGNRTNKVRIAVRGKLPKPQGAPPDNDQVTNAITRGWKPSKPVLHMAAALLPARTHSLPDALRHPAWVVTALGELPMRAFHYSRCGIVKPEQLIMLLPTA